MISWVPSTHDTCGGVCVLALHRLSWTNRAKTSLTSVGKSAGSLEPILRPSPAAGHAAEILSAEDAYLGYDAETCP